MKVKVSVYHGPSGSGRTDLIVPFVPGETTVGQALEEAACRLAASGGAKGANGTDENESPMVPNLTLARAPSEVRPVTSLYIGQDWIKNRVPHVGSKQIRYHVVPAMISSDEEEESDDDPEIGPESEANKPSEAGAGPFKDSTKDCTYNNIDLSNTDGCRLMMVSPDFLGGRTSSRRDIFSWASWGSKSSSERRQDILSRRLYEYHAQEGICTTVWDKIESVRVPVDDVSSLRINLTELGDIRSVFTEQSREEKTITDELDLVLPVSEGAATFADLKSVGK